MRWSCVVAVLALSACSDFDRLGNDARCRLTQCDAGLTPDAGGNEDAGSDAGTPDAGVDAGAVDASVELRVLWALSDPAPANYLAVRPGFVVAVEATHVMHGRAYSLLVDGDEVSPDSGVFYPAGSIIGDVVLIDTSGAFVLADGGASAMATADALRTFIPGERGAVTAIAPFALVPFSEQLIDGGTPTRTDGGPIVTAPGVAAIFGSTLESLIFPTGPAKAAGSLGLEDGGTTLSWVPPGSDAGMISADDQTLTQTDGVDCPAPVIDAVVTRQLTLMGAPDHRLLQLAECRPGVFSVIAWSRDARAFANELSPQNVSEARMSISIEGSTAPRRSPFVVWKAADELFRLSRFGEEGNAISLTRAVTEVAPSARIGALAVDDANNPLVVLEAASVTFRSGLNTTEVLGPGSEVVIASFDDGLRLRWALPLPGANKLRVNSATFASGALVLDVTCPANVVNGDFCAPDRTSFAIRVGLPDGGLP